MANHGFRSQLVEMEMSSSGKWVPVFIFTFNSKGKFIIKFHFQKLLFSFCLILSYVNLNDNMKAWRLQLSSKLQFRTFIRSEEYTRGRFPDYNRWIWKINIHIESQANNFIPFWAMVQYTADGICGHKEAFSLSHRVQTLLDTQHSQCSCLKS